MAIKIPYTSSIDKYLIILRVIVNFAYLIIIVGGLILLLDYIELDLGGTGNIIVFLTVLLIGYFISSYLFKITAGRFFATLSSYLYIRNELKTKIRWKDAAFVSFLFTPNKTGKWYSMYKVLELPEKERSSYLIKFAKRVILES